MKNNLFRKESLDRVNSPEQLNEYVRVTSPSIWLILSAFVLLLVGFLVWSIFGTLQTKRPIEVVSKNGQVMGYIPTENRQEIAPGMTVIVQDGNREVTGTILEISSQPVQITSDDDPYLLYLGDYESDDFVYTCPVEVSDLKDGVYAAEVIVEQVHPAAFVKD